MLRRLGCVIALAAALAVGGTGVANAATTIGSTTQPSGSGADGCSPNGTFFQQSSQTFVAAVPVSSGQVSSWSTNTSSDVGGTTVELVVLRPASAGTYTVIAVDAETLPTPLPAGQIATFTPATPISVVQGDVIGIAGSTLDHCAWGGGATPATDVDGLAATMPPSPPADGQTAGTVGTAPGTRVDVSASVVTSIDAGVTMSTSPPAPTVGSLALLASTVTDHSADPATIDFTDVVRNGLSIDAVAAGGGSCAISGQTVTCTILNLYGGGSAPVDVLVTPKADGTYSNLATVTSPAASDPNPANNTASTRMNVGPASSTSCVVPSLRRIAGKAATKILKLLHCNVKVKHAKERGVPKGAVLKTKPRAGTYPAGRTITLVVRK